MTMVTRVAAVVAAALVLMFLAGMGAAPRSLAQGEQISRGAPISAPVREESERPLAGTSDQEEPRLVNVTGEAEVRVVPDEVVLTVGVETRDEKLSTAKSDNDKRIRKVLDLTEDYGIEAKHVQTSYISVEPRYDDDYYGSEVLKDYWVRKTIVITLKDISKFEDLLTDLLEAEVNYVHGIQFRTSELRKHRDRARALAITAAQEKAVAMAGELGQEVGRPRAINEYQSGWWSGYGSWWGSGWGSAMTQNVIQDVGGGLDSGEGTLAPGQITVKAQVNVSFEME